MGSQIVDLDCPSCGKKHQNIPTNKCSGDLWIQGQEVARFVVCPETRKTVYLGHERGKLVGLLKEN